MAQGRPRIKFTFHDYRTAPDDRRYELLERELLMVPAPNTRHQRILIRLSTALHEFVTVRGLGEVFSSPFDAVLSNYDVLQPDLLLVSKERSHMVTDDNIQGGPDLVVEVLSTSTADRDLGYKRTLYARHRVREYWVVDPEARTIEVLALGQEDFTRHGLYASNQVLQSPVLPDLAILLEEVL